MFSQRDEEEHILKFFRKQTGRFLDIGAYDGKCFSTTHALALIGWGGVCVEPSPSVLPALHKQYDPNPNINILEVAVSDVTGKVTFFDSGGDMVSSINKKHVELWTQGSGCSFTKIQVKSLTVLDLFEKIGYDFEFISLDTEGTNIEIFSQFPFEKLDKVKMFCIEFDSQPNEVLRMVEPYKFRLLHQTAENLLLTR